MERDEPETPNSLDKSAETVVQVKLHPKPAVPMSLSAVAECGHHTEMSTMITDIMLPEKYLIPAAMMDFSQAPEQHFDENFVRDAFSCVLDQDGSALSDNKTLMDLAEAENHEHFNDDHDGVGFEAGFIFGQS